MLGRCDGVEKEAKLGQVERDGAPTQTEGEDADDRLRVERCKGTRRANPETSAAIKFQMTKAVAFQKMQYPASEGARRSLAAFQLKKHTAPVNMVLEDKPAVPRLDRRTLPFLYRIRVFNMGNPAGNSG